jgi:acetylornithine deacetylase/succinyl-diaminopimelate desuccinylase-like protein
MPLSPTGRIHASLDKARARLRAGDRRVLETQVTVSEIAAPTGEEHERAQWISARFRALGLSGVSIDDAGNVIGRRDGIADDDAVVVCAHLDTVFPRGTPLRVRHQGPCLLGPGIGDNGRGLAGMLALAETIDGRRLRTQRPIVFVATTGEEGVGDLRGAKHYFASAERRIHAAIALDGAGDERVVHRSLGSRRYRIVYDGPGGHSWAAFGVPNAVHAAALAGAKLTSLAIPRDPRTTLSIGRIGGGIAINAIPDNAWLEVDVRSVSASQLDRLDRELRLVARAAEQEENARRTPGTPPLVCTIERIGDRPCGEVPADDPLVVSAIDATRLVGREPELTTASTDANVPISAGIPAIAIGAGGRGGDAHTSGEWFENAEGTLGLARALTILVTAAGISV